MSILEGKGAVFSLDEDGYLHAVLDGIAGLTQSKAEEYAAAALALRKEIKTLLSEQRSAHWSAIGSERLAVPFDN